MIRMKVRLIDVAKKAGVSIATVSIVLNDPDTPRITQKTKDNVMAVVKELKYVPNAAARSLVTNKSRTIGLIIPDIENPFFSTLAKIIEQRCRAEKFVMIMMNTLEDHKNDPGIIRSLRQRSVDGMIIAPSSQTFNDDKEIKEVLNNLDVPFVLVDRMLHDFPVNQVYFNNKTGEYLATKYLIENGHRKIGFISTQNYAMTGFYRHLGYLKAIEEAGIPVNESYIKHGDYTTETGYQFAKELYESGVTAIACANDMIAFGVRKRLVEMGVRVPEDVSLVGYDNLNLNEYLDRGLSSVDQDITKMAHHAVDILMNALEGNEEIVEVMLEPTLKIRNSVKNMHQGAL